MLMRNLLFAEFLMADYDGSSLCPVTDKILSYAFVGNTCLRCIQVSAEIVNGVALQKKKNQI